VVFRPQRGWCLKSTRGTVILGASRVSQLKENLAPSVVPSSPTGDTIKTTVA
jgi:aryl-alcohol dehydrogenase-like predicted oxidoreductase